MRSLSSKKNIFFSKLFVIICLSIYSGIILLRNFNKEANYFLIIATILFMISLVVLVNKLRKDFKKINNNVNKSPKIKFIEIFNFIGGLLIVIMIFLKKFEIISTNLMDIVYLFIISIFIINIVTRIHNKIN
jgi:hypothetical protein